MLVLEPELAHVFPHYVQHAFIFIEVFSLFFFFPSLFDSQYVTFFTDSIPETNSGLCLQDFIALFTLLGCILSVPFHGFTKPVILHALICSEMLLDVLFSSFVYSPLDSYVSIKDYFPRSTFL